MMESLNDPWSYYQGPADFAELAPERRRPGRKGSASRSSSSRSIPTARHELHEDRQRLRAGRSTRRSPARRPKRPGIQPGDVIVAVDGKSLDGMTIDQATALIKGPKDTTVTLGIDRNGTTLQITIVRKVYNRPEVDTRTLANGAVAYIDVERRQRPGLARSSRTRLAKALAAGQKNVILDLRGNLGGYVAGRRPDRQPVHRLGRSSSTSRTPAATQQKITARPERPGHGPLGPGGRAGRRQHGLGGGDPRRRAAVPRPSQADRRQDVRQGRRPGVAAAAQQLRRHPPDRRPLADPGQGLDPGQGPPAGHRRSAPTAPAPGRTRSSTPACRQLGFPPEPSTSSSPSAERRAPSPSGEREPPARSHAPSPTPSPVRLAPTVARIAGYCRYHARERKEVMCSVDTDALHHLARSRPLETGHRGW